MSLKNSMRSVYSCFPGLPAKRFQQAMVNVTVLHLCKAGITTLSNSLSHLETSSLAARLKGSESMPQQMQHDRGTTKQLQSNTGMSLHITGC